MNKVKVTAQKAPSATAFVGATGLGALIVWIFSFWNITIPDYALVAIAGALGGAFSFVMQYGLAGVWNLILHGRAQPVPPVPPAP